MTTRGSTNLNRILRVTAHLLFEKGQGVSEVYGLMQSFVERSMLEKWYRSYYESNGLPSDINQAKPRRRMPMPPIDWNAISVEGLRKQTQSEQDWF